MTCLPTDASAIPSSVGLLLWPATHPQNPQRVDLVVAPASTCAQLSPGGVCNTTAANTIIGLDGAPRYAIGTAAALNMEGAETLSCQ